MAERGRKEVLFEGRKMLQGILPKQLELRPTGLESSRVLLDTQSPDEPSGRQGKSVLRLARDNTQAERGRSIEEVENQHRGDAAQ